MKFSDFILTDAIITDLKAKSKDEVILEMVTAPFRFEDGTYIYYRKDSTYYSFLITDNPDYSYGGVYSYYNGDTLKVRCYPEAKGVNITKRFSGNYSLTDEQKNAITFTLQKEALGTADGWVDVESHTYGEFSYGSINFNIGKADGADLEDFATYRVVEENALPEELQGIIEENVAVTVSYQMDGRPVEEDSNEFLVDPDDKLAFSYNFTFTNQYIDHKLTIIKVDKNTGHALPGTVFTVYAAVSDTPVGEYTTDFLCTMQDGSLRVRECVSRDHLMKPMNVKLLDASRGYWQKNGVADWKIVTDAEKEA